MIIADRIASYLKDNGIKQKDVANSAGMSPVALCSVLHGKRKLSVDEYVNICNALDVKVEKFVD